ncbi:MAG: excinuclease ABC subunit UvrC, partial [Duodenibacillus sp.]|nr:excinuclease ABC subunit UvrC [Duodenibacillus sp.]
MIEISQEVYKEALAGLPSLPGVYRYFDAEGACLYVGKARDLRRRVSSYFQKNDLSPRIALMVSKVAGLETTAVRSEAEALLLENNLIKALSPKYNILFRDDKSYPYIKVTAGDFPRVCYYRGGVDKVNAYFGPYPNAAAVREAIGVLQKVFRLRTCEEAVFRNRSRACLMGQMGRCSAPCVGAVSAADYARDVEAAASFLRGEAGHVMDAMRERMMQAAGALRFEEAAAIRDRIAALSDALHQQSVDTTGGDTDADVIAVQVQEGAACVNLAMVRGGRHLGDRAFFPSVPRAGAAGLTRAEVFEAFALQHYASAKAPEVIITADCGDYAEAEAHISALAGRRVTLVHEPQTVRRQWLAMAQQGAQLALARRLAEAGGEERRLEDLWRVLGLHPGEEERERFTAECFDISHTAGEATQASCVVFRGRAMDSSRYRRFNITGVAPGDDYAAMRQALA